MAEIAGVVLGGFPLIISALEHYREGFEPLQEWWKFESDFSNFIEELGTQQTRFDMNLERLLDPFVTSGSQMNALLDQRNPEAWQDPALKRDIQKRLGSSYEWYIAICKKMDATLSSLEERLGIENGQVKYIDASRWDHELRRLRISFSKKKFKHVKLLTKYNDELHQLLSTNDELTPSRERRRKTPMIGFVQSLQHHSQVLYSGILSRWKCKCPAPHGTRLLLERHIAGDDPNSLSLHLLLEGAGVRKPIEVRIGDSSHQDSAQSSSAKSSTGNLLELKRQVHARAVKTPPTSPQGSACHTAAGSLQPVAVTAPASRSPSPLHFFQRSKKTVRIAQTTVPTTIQLQPVQTVLKPNEIKDICSEMAKWKSTNDCLGYIPAAQQSRFLFYPNAKYQDLNHQCGTVTLEDLLPGRSASPSPAQTMTRKQRFVLANILAFTLLQLQPTPWLSSTWNKRDITFVYPLSSASPQLSRPFIGKSFPATPPGDPSSNEACKQSLFRLGILLLELTFNERLETLPLRQKYLGPQGAPNEYTDLCTAKAWHKDVEGECGEGLSEAIRRCIDCSFGSKVDWSNEAFLEEYSSHVLEPLKQLLRQWEGTM